MKKKSLVAMGLAGVMTIGMCVPVLANPIGPNSDGTGKPEPGSAETAVEITEPIKYSITIPANFTGSEFDKDISLELSISGVNLEPGKAVKVATNSNIELKNQTDESVKWNMLLQDGENPFTSVEFTNNTSKTLKLVNGTNSSERPAGIYKGSVQFNVTYENATPVA